MSENGKTPDGAGAKPSLPGREQRALPRRFYKDVTVAEAVSNGETGLQYRVLLDGRPTRTPAKRC